MEDITQIKGIIEKIIETTRAIKKVKKSYKALCKIEKIANKYDLEITRGDNYELIIKGFI